MNRSYYTILLLLLLLGACPFAKAQNILQDTVTWNSTRAVGQVNNDELNYNCQFITRTNQSIDWIQKNGARVNHFNVTSVDGTWTNAAVDGQLVYHVAMNNFTGDVTLSRASGQTTIHLNISEGGQSGMNYVFYIASIQAGQ